MRLGPVEVPVPTLVLIALAVSIGGAVIIGSATSGAAFGPYNPGWEGLSEVRDEADDAALETTTVTNTEQYDEITANGTVALIVAPDNYTAEDRDRIRTFVEDGGTVVVASRSPHTNQLLEDLGTAVRVDGAPLRDEQAYDQSPNFPVVETVANHTYVHNTDGVVLNHGTALIVDTPGEATALATSSEYAYLDRDGNGELSEDEDLAARPLIAMQPVGDGEVVAVSDPSVFINVMLDHEPNRMFVANLFAEHDRLVLDQTSDDVPPLRVALWAIRDSTVLSGILGLALVLTVVGWERRLHHRVLEWRHAPSTSAHPPATPIDQASKTDPDALEAYLADQYPEWEASRRARVAKTIAETQKSHTLAECRR